MRSFFTSFKQMALLPVALLMLLAFAGAGLAQPAAEGQEASVDGWTSQLERIEKNADILQYDDPGLTRLQDEAQKIGLAIEKYRTSLMPKLTELKSQLDKLGPEPAKDAPEEAESIKEERRKLTEEFQKIDGEHKRAGVAATRTTQLISKLQELRRTVFAREIFKRQTALYNPEGWSSLSADLRYTGARFASIFQGFAEKAQPLSRLLALLGGVLTLLLMVTFIGNRLVNRLRQTDAGERPAFVQQAASTVIVSLLRILPFVLALGGLYAGFLMLDAFTPEMRQLVSSLLSFILLVVIVAGLSTSLLAPNRAEWRMIPLPDGVARRMNGLIIGLAATYGLNRYGAEVNQLVSAPLTLTWLVSLLSSVLFAVLLIQLLRLPFGLREVKGERVAAHSLWPLWLKLPLWLVALSILIALLFGFLAFAQFLAGQVVLTGAIIASVLLIHKAVNELRHDFVAAQGLTGSWARSKLLLEDEPRKLIGFGFSLFLNLVLLIVAIPLILFNWGFSFTDLQSWSTALFYGFDVGSFRFSIAAILMAIALFALGILVTRFLQRWLDAGILKSPRIQSGVSNSIRTGVGYLGFLLSALIAVSYVGLDFTNLAIVAGALSVGIGFGLQSIVNNFVSGLILLVERPVKVGDWVIVGSHQGFVRRISVRSTEIETFDRSSVIVPNSELITGVVTNWTHGNSTGRVIVGVGVAYDSNPRQVYKLLEEIAKGHPKTLTYPAPRIVFEEFGASSLDFTIRVYIGNITEVYDVTTELRMRIYETFKAQNIEIAFPQLDLHIKR